MATSIVYSCQLTYDLPSINKSVMRPFHIISPMGMNMFDKYSFVTFIVRCDVYSSEFLSLQVLDMF